MESISSTNSNNVSINNDIIDEVKHKDSEDNAQKPLDISSDKTPKTGIAIRAIKCTGALFLGMFTVPIMAVVGTLSGFVSGVANTYHFLIGPAWKDNKICALLLSVTLIPPCAIAFGGLIALSNGLYSGIIRGAQAAHKFSFEPIKKTFIETKKALSGEKAREIVETLKKEQEKSKNEKVINIMKGVKKELEKENSEATKDTEYPDND